MMLKKNLIKQEVVKKTFYNMLIMCSFGNFLLAKRPMGPRS